MKDFKMSPRFKKCALTLLLFASVSNVQIQAAPLQFPRGCKPVGFQFKNGFLVLTPVSPQEGQSPDTVAQTELEPSSKKPQSLYFLHNISQQRIQIKGYKLPDQTFSADHFNVIEPMQWGTFAVDDSMAVLRCDIGSTHESTRINCAETIEVCQYPRAKFAEHNKGTYWVSQSTTLQDAIQASDSNGILLRW